MQEPQLLGKGARMGPGYHFQEEPGNKMAATKRVLNLGWLAEEVDDRVLRVAFIPFGDITDTHIPLDYETGESPQRLMFRCLMPGKNLEKLLSHVHSVYGWMLQQLSTTCFRVIEEAKVAII
ncbi:Peptidyl-prolyl cis-trans isomerase E [Camelus dromedarius]|uniref:Peptidyl-prolyl cis-trans isomerase E n=1 Tax=Camelus dromedarius TaxID=9838 RepID=A0A5N4DAL1_CAMDR|nr:Peptidyl-prolyl cis-trans isomerase E [Camelus dromedarius]